MADRLKVTTPSEREIVITRVFEAPRALVWDAHTKPELVRRWLLGPEGWTMPVCEIDLRVDGRYRYEWVNGDRRMGMGGVFREVAAPRLLVTSEKFDEDWTGGETTVTQAFTEARGRTTLTLTVLYSSEQARDRALATPMTGGMEQGYQRLDRLMATTTRVRKVAFTMYPVTDVARARKFYEETLGLEVGMHGGQGGMWWVEYDLPGGGCIALTNTTGATPGGGGGGMIALEVEDLDEMIAELKGKGVEFLSGVVHGPHCRMATCKDSEGNSLLLHQLGHQLPRSEP